MLLISGGVEVTGNDGGTGWFGGSLLIVNAALGAGLLNFPSAYHQAGGVLAGGLVQLVIRFDQNYIYVHPYSCMIYRFYRSCWRL